jgi:hypothetical protein
MGYESDWPFPVIAQDEEFFFYALIHYHGVGHYTDSSRKPHVSSFCWRYDRGVDYWVKFDPDRNQKWNYLT